MNNIVPRVYDASFSVLHDHELTGQLSGYDPDGDGITAQLATGADHGTVTLSPDGHFIYEPQQGYTGTDYFSYTWSDGIAISEVAWVTIRVGPIAYGSGFGVLHDRVLTVEAPGLFSFVDSGGEPATIRIAPDANPLGRLTLRDDGSFTYVPPPGWTGMDWFAYQVSVDNTFWSEGWVYVNVYNTPPELVVPLEFFVVSGAQLVLTPTDLATYFADEDGDELRVTIDLDAPENAGVAERISYDSSLGAWVYHAPGEFRGTDIVWVEVSDGAASETAPMKIIVAPDNQPPAFTQDIYEFFIGELWKKDWLVGAIIANDPEGQGVTYTIVDGNDGNWFKIDGNSIKTNQDLTYATPLQTVLTVQASDTTGNAAQAYVYITIRPTVVITMSYNGGERFSDTFGTETGDTIQILFQRLSRDISQPLDFTYSVTFGSTDKGLASREDIENIDDLVGPNNRKTLTFAANSDLVATAVIRVKPDNELESLEKFRVTIDEPGNYAYRTLPFLYDSLHDTKEKKDDFYGYRQAAVTIAEGWVLFAGENTQKHLKDGEGRVVHWNDTNQGGVNDCNLVAALAGLAQRNPEYIFREMFWVQEGGTSVKVRIWDKDKNEFEWVEVPFELRRGWNQMQLGEDYNNKESRRYEIWPILAEEAFIKKFGWQNVSHGFSAERRLFQLTGQAGEWYELSFTQPGFANQRKLQEYLNMPEPKRPILLLTTPKADKWDKKDAITLLSNVPEADENQNFGSLKSTKSARKLSAWHAYLILDYWRDNHGRPIGVVLFNPWARPDLDGGFIAKVTWPEMKQYNLSFIVHPGTVQR